MNRQEEVILRKPGSLCGQQLTLEMLGTPRQDPDRPQDPRSFEVSPALEVGTIVDGFVHMRI